MPTFSAAVTFAAVAFLMALSPGPNMLYLASRSLCQGRDAGFASLGGVCTGMFCYMLATAAGLSALFKAVPVAYDAVRWAGALYLLWLAYRILTRRSSALAPTSLLRESRAHLYRRGLLTCLLNPKIVVTYGALLPQFVDPVSHVLSQTAVLGLVQIVAAASAHSLVIIAAAGVASITSRHHAFAKLQRYLLGSVLAALAVRVAVERRSAP
ncbi:MAG TPA: LysE family translocator [Steroidobacteraceae bacterium]